MIAAFRYRALNSNSQQGESLAERLHKALHEISRPALMPTTDSPLSIIAAVREAYAYRKADKELIKQYRFMQRIFASARVVLDRTHDPAEQREILLPLGDAALTEHVKWTLMQRERQVEQGKL